MEPIVIHSDDSDIIMLDTRTTNKMKKSVKEAKRKVMKNETDGSILLSRTFSKKCRYSERDKESYTNKLKTLGKKCSLLVDLTVPQIEPETERYSSFKKPDLRQKYVTIERIVPHCLRKPCKWNNKHKYKRHARKKTKFHHQKYNSTIYEDISSESFQSDLEVDELITATRERMKKQFHERVTPVIRQLTPEKNSFDLSSVHSRETLLIEKADESDLEVIDSCYSPISTASVDTFIIETNNNVDVGKA